MKSSCWLTATSMFRRHRVLCVDGIYAKERQGFVTAILVVIVVTYRGPGYGGRKSSMSAPACQAQLIIC